MIQASLDIQPIVGVEWSMAWFNRRRWQRLVSQLSHGSAHSITETEGARHVHVTAMAVLSTGAANIISRLFLVHQPKCVSDGKGWSDCFLTIDWLILNNDCRKLTW